MRPTGKPDHFCASCGKEEIFYTDNEILDFSKSELKDEELMRAIEEAASNRTEAFLQTVGMLDNKIYRYLLCSDCTGVDIVDCKHRAYMKLEVDFTEKEDYDL